MVDSLNIKLLPILFDCVDGVVGFIDGSTSTTSCWQDGVIDDYLRQV